MKLIKMLDGGQYGYLEKLVFVVHSVVHSQDFKDSQGLQNMDKLVNIQTMPTEINMKLK